MEVKENLTQKGQRDWYLIQKAVNESDQKSYSELLSLYRESIYFMMLKMTNNHYDAEDLTIEAFGKAFKNLSNYTTEYAFSTWLYRIATNNCIDFIRKSKRIPIADQMDLLDENRNNIVENMSSEELTPEEDIINKQKINRMRQLVESLKPHYRTLIEMRYFDELSYEEIAEQLNIPLGTVKARLFRARDLLYNILKTKQESI
ncbi:MAG: sigma-70 family RNA polymerase sigma factor [Lentimicrobiaceae bacterium]|jgi:RNA polymerase sigma-70 factor (ECF subfamily)|nr:sigma-70 family RNA polymerase sigma factor [Lentimicrobiaceae bacterium]